MENLNELSVSRLSYYAHQASKEQYVKAKQGKDTAPKDKKRYEGIVRAIDRMKIKEAEEKPIDPKKKKNGAKALNMFNEEELSEISKDRLGKYMDAARERVKKKQASNNYADKDIKTAQDNINKPYSTPYSRVGERWKIEKAEKIKNKNNKEIDKRKAGISKAAAKYNRKKIGESIERINEQLNGIKKRIDPPGSPMRTFSSPLKPNKPKQQRTFPLGFKSQRENR